MASPPLTDRKYAYFKVTGYGDCNQVTNILKLEPTKSWSQGEIDTRRNKPRRIMFWALESGLNDQSPIEDHISTLLNKLEAKADCIANLPIDFAKLIQCVGYFPASEHGLHLPSEVIKRLANLGLDIDYDFYYISDNGHELG